MKGRRRRIQTGQETLRHGVRNCRALLFLIVALGCLHEPSNNNNMVVAYMRMGGDLDHFLQPLLEDGQLDTIQYDVLSSHCLSDEFEFDLHTDLNDHPDTDCAASMRFYLQQQINNNDLSLETSNYIALLFNLDMGQASHTRNTYANPVGSTTRNVPFNGNVLYHGRADFAPVVASNNEIYNGIWGYHVGQREYALQCHSLGLDIIDVTWPWPIRVQFLPMPGGRIWRDVDIYYHANTDTFYAYVGGQDGASETVQANVWVINLSNLSGGALAHGWDSNPIPPSDYKVLDSIHRDVSHTLYVHQDAGWLVLNSARASTGCRFLDVASDPWNPTWVGSYGGSQRDCHDGYILADTTLSGYNTTRDVLFVGDGFSSTFRTVDITDMKDNTWQELWNSQGTLLQPGYAHSCWIYMKQDTTYWFVLEESNVYDIAVFDATDPRNPILIHTFQTPSDTLVHNAQVMGDYLVVAYYLAGLRVYDISDPRNPVEVGFLDTFDPSFGGGAFDGAWNVFVGLPSGKILVSDTFKGTFVASISSTGDGRRQSESHPALGDDNNGRRFLIPVISDLFSGILNAIGSVFWDSLLGSVLSCDRACFTSCSCATHRCDTSGSGLMGTCTLTEQELRPSLRPTEYPTAFPTAEPLSAPNPLPSLSPTARPTVNPTAFPTALPVSESTPMPTRSPSLSPRLVDSPTAFPIAVPSFEPSSSPSFERSLWPSQEPSPTPALTTLPPSSSPRLQAGWHLGAAGTESCTDVCSIGERPPCFPAAMTDIDSGNKLQAVLTSLGVACNAGPFPAVNEDAPNLAQVATDIVGCAYQISDIACDQAPLDPRTRRLCCCGNAPSQCPI